MDVIITRHCQEVTLTETDSVEYLRKSCQPNISWFKFAKLKWKNIYRYALKSQFSKFITNKKLNLSKIEMLTAYRCFTISELGRNTLKYHKSDYVDTYANNIDCDTDPFSEIWKSPLPNFAHTQSFLRKLSNSCILILKGWNLKERSSSHTPTNFFRK